MTSKRRTEAEICSDAARILSMPSLHSRTRRMVVYQAIWDVSELKGKYVNKDFYWSRAAWNWRNANRGVRTNLRREHVIPMVVTISHILLLRSPTERQLEKPLRYAARICVVTVNEERRLNKAYKSKMPANVSWASGKGVWERYAKLKIPHRKSW